MQNTESCLPLRVRKHAVHALNQFNCPKTNLIWKKHSPQIVTLELVHKAHHSVQRIYQYMLTNKIFILFSPHCSPHSHIIIVFSLHHWPFQWFDFFFNFNFFLLIFKIVVQFFHLIISWIETIFFPRLKQNCKAKQTFKKKRTKSVIRKWSAFCRVALLKTRSSKQLQTIARS